MRRERLQQRLSRLDEYKVAVIEGAPGSGKSTLLAAFLQENPALQARWISLDENDDDMRTLWSYVLEALRPELGERADALRELVGATLQAGDVDSVLVELVNNLQPDGDVFLILDDAHHITHPRVVESLQFFLRYSSERVHLLLLTRQEPALSLGEWRMAGQLLEIRNDDLKVSGEEAQRFLAVTLGLRLDEKVMKRLADVAEGWLGGLQLLGIAAEQRRGQIDSIAALGHPVVEYLSEEIFNALPDVEQDFLIQTSILTYLHEDVCRAVTESDGAGDVLRSILTKNLFVIAVDEDAGLYRYHHLFHEFLHQRRRRLPADERRELHVRAARFYGESIDRPSSSSDALEQTVAHYLSAEEYDAALDVIGGMPSGAESWRLLQKVPLHALEGKPDFIFQRLFSHMAEQQLEECAAIVHYFRGTFADGTGGSLLELFGMLLGGSPLAVQVQRLTTQHLRDLPLGDETKAILYSLLAMVLTLAEREQEALTCLLEADRIVPSVQNPYIRYYCLQFKGQLKEHMGDLAECEAIYGDMFRLVARHVFLAPVLVTAEIGIVGILLKGARLAEARTYLDKVKPRALSEGAAVVSAELEAAYLYNELEFHLLGGEREEAEQIVGRLLDLDLLNNSLYAPPMLRYLLLLNIATDAQLARFQFEQIAAPTWQDYLLQARLLARADRAGDALELVDGRLRRMRKQQAKLPLVEGLLLKAELLLSTAVQTGAAEGLDFERGARDALREAIHYSYKNQLLAPFLLSGKSIPHMVRSLRHEDEAELTGAEAAFLDELISRWDAIKAEAERREGRSLLSEREMQVLHVLAEGTTNKQIAERLFISVATVKSHIINVYSKLGVSNRVEAVEEARRRGLIG